MSTDAKSEVTEILGSLADQGRSRVAADELFPVVYAALRRLAGRYMQRERQHHTLDATALVHEAYERLVDQSRVDWRGRSHFFAVAAQVTRHLLVDHARHHRRVKRGRDWQRVTLQGAVEVLAARDIDLDELLTLDRALNKLAALDPQQAQVVELRYFADMSVEETAQFLGISKRTVNGYWAHARAWLKRELSGET